MHRRENLTRAGHLASARAEPIREHRSESVAELHRRRRRVSRAGACWPQLGRAQWRSHVPARSPVSPVRKPSRGILKVVTDKPARVRSQPSGSGPTCRRVLGALPGWFGIEQAVEDYVAVADRSPTLVASVDDEDVGFLTLVRHSPHAAAVHYPGGTSSRGTAWHEPDPAGRRPWLLTWRWTLPGRGKRTRPSCGRSSTPLPGRGIPRTAESLGARGLRNNNSRAIQTPRWASARRGGRVPATLVRLTAQTLSSLRTCPPLASSVELVALSRGNEAAGSPWVSTNH
jgi:hypothetical protein